MRVELLLTVLFPLCFPWPLLAQSIVPSNEQTAAQKPAASEAVQKTPAAAQYVTVSGGVRTPQRLQWAPDLTLAAAIANCGGFTDFSGGVKIRIIREGQVIGTYRLRDIQKKPETDPKLLPGDRVIVPE